MIRALGFEVVCDRCQTRGRMLPEQPTGPDRAAARREARAQGWGRRWRPRKGRERGHFEDICPECLKAAAQ